ncbi:MAG TPA: dihydrofolate reductase family protein [Candidatus Eisenbacteria bacterium]|nr:dihydrofolate reductase family protein [Candidatus Eisenbacteria bacterium]
MRNIIVISMITIDGVMQAPGGPEEDTSGDFKYGGWTVPYADEHMGKVLGEELGHPFDLLLGRKTYDIWNPYWPRQKGFIAEAFNSATKYVASTTLIESKWQGTEILKDNVVDKIKKLKQQIGPELQVHGSGTFVQTLLTNDLVDELRRRIFPITLGSGKRLFESGSVPAAFTLEDCSHGPSGVIFANFKRDGEVRTGLF